VSLSRRERVTRWLAAVSWATLISILSTSWFSGDHTGSVLLPLLGFLFPSASPATLALMHHLVRKLAHFTEYFVLSVLLYRALAESPAWSLRAAVIAVGSAGLYSVADEAHQIFVPGRTPAIGDCLLDLSGAAAAQLLLAVWLPRRASKNPAVARRASAG
jgi:VanZ family protein